MDYDEVLGSVDDPARQALDPPQRCQRTLDALKHLLLRELGQASPEAIRAVLAARDKWTLNLGSRRTLWHSSGRV